MFRASFAFFGIFKVKFSYRHNLPGTQGERSQRITGNCRVKMLVHHQGRIREMPIMNPLSASSWGWRFLSTSWKLLISTLLKTKFWIFSLLTVSWHYCGIVRIFCGKTLGFKDKITCLEKVWRRCLWKLLYWCWSEWQCTVVVAEGIVY